MPALFNNLRFVGTGEPIKPDFGNTLRLNREPSAQGIMRSGADDIRDFREITKSKTKPTPQELGQTSAKITRKIISGNKIDLIA